MRTRPNWIVTVAGLACVLTAAAFGAAPAGAASGKAGKALVTKPLSFTADDGVKLHATIGGRGGITKRPLIVEDGPYSQAVDPFAGPAYNYIELQWRGTGQSDGTLSTTGPRDQKDLSEFLGWACRQPFSNRRIGLYGFSASAIVVYNAMRLHLPCVKAAAMMAGTVDLYRDLLYIGGIFNFAAGAVVETGIGEPTLENGPQRVLTDPGSIPKVAEGYVLAPTMIRHDTEDGFWRDRTFKGDHDHIPILADTGFYDVEERGPFMIYRETRQYGSHLLVIGAHDGWPSNTPGPFPQYTQWFDHYVRGIDNGITRDPAVSVYLSKGSHARLVNGHYTHLTGSTWPLPGTRWHRLYLSAAKSGSSARSLNDGTLSARPAGHAVQNYPFVPSDPLATDEHNISTVSGAQELGLSIDGMAEKFPALTDMTAPGLTALTYTTPKFTKPVNVVGPASLDVFASSTAPTTDLVAVLADVWPDGTAHAVAAGQLRTSYPNVVRSRSMVDHRGDIVDPYAVFSSKDNGSSRREYHVEFAPIGNHFEPGHRLRLYLVGTSAAQTPSPPGVDSVSLGGVTPSRLMIPTVAVRRTHTPTPTHHATTHRASSGATLASTGGSATLPLIGVLLIAAAASTASRRIHR